MFTVKYHSYGTVDKFKVHLVVKRFTQMYDVDFFETFSPIAHISSIRVLVSVAVAVAKS